MLGIQQGTVSSRLSRGHHPFTLGLNPAVAESQALESRTQDRLDKKSARVSITTHARHV